MRPKLTRIRLPLLLSALAVTISSIVGIAVAQPLRREAGASGVIAYVAKGDAIWLMSADGSGQRRLAGGSFPSFSPDGSVIAFSSVRPPGLLVINADGSSKRWVTRGLDVDPTWSPDGGRGGRWDSGATRARAGVPGVRRVSAALTADSVSRRSLRIREIELTN